MRIPVRVAPLPLLAILLVGCSDGRDVRVPVPQLISDTPQSVQQVVVEGRGQTARLLRDADDWIPGAGTTAGSALLMGDADGLLPLLAYRCFPETDLNQPQWGFASPTLSFEVTTAEHDRTVTIGSPTFNLAGFYSRVDGDSQLCLVPRSSVAALMSVALGKPVRIKTAEDAKIARLLDSDGNPRPVATLDPWLAQSQRAAHTQKAR